MFAGIRNFLHRHRRKFYIGGGIIGGVVLLSRYAEYKLSQWHENQTRSIIEKQKRRQHYEKTRQTANATALSFSSSVSKILSDELGTDELIQAISTKPENKKIYWEELKILGFSRSIATIYTSALVSCVVHTKLMLLGGYTFGGSNVKDVEEVPIQCQEKYLAHLQYFVEKGLPSLFKKIRLAVYSQIHSLPLNQLVSLEKLEGILKDITLLLCGEKDNSLKTEDEQNYKLNPWSQYIIHSSYSNANIPEEAMLWKMTLEMTDIIDGDDFNIVVQSLVQHGLNHLMDYVADFYPSPTHDQFNSSSATEKQDSLSLDTGAKSLNGHMSHINPLIKSSMTVAKLVPILSGLVHSCLSPAPGQLLQFVLLNEQLENLSFNIYEAFSVHP